MTPEEAQRLRTHAQEKDTRAIIERDFSASRMNPMKWAKVAGCLSDLPVRCRIKFVDVEDRTFELGAFWHVTGDWFDSGSLSVFTAVSIEWLDINPTQEVDQGMLVKPKRISHAEELERRLSSVSVPYHWEGDCIRIIGHVRKSNAE